jgi:hypothetical protein
MGGRDGSNDPWDNQRIDTGGGEYLQAEDENILSFNNNNRPSPKGSSNSIAMGKQQKKK